MDGDSSLLFPDEGVDAPRRPQIEPVIRATLNAPVLLGFQLAATNRFQPMLTYKQRTIELTPKRDEDGAWRCPYRICEFRPTCWGYHKGCPEETFMPHHAAAAVSRKEAKRFIDSLAIPIKTRPTTRRSLLLLRLQNTFPSSLTAFRIERDSPDRIKKDSPSGTVLWRSCTVPRNSYSSCRSHRGLFFAHARLRILLNQAVV